MLNCSLWILGSGGIRDPWWLECYLNLREVPWGLTLGSWGQSGAAWDGASGRNISVAMKTERLIPLAVWKGTDQKLPVKDVSLRRRSSTPQDLRKGQYQVEHTIYTCVLLHGTQMLSSVQHNRREHTCTHPLLVQKDVPSGAGSQLYSASTFFQNHIIKVTM